MKSKKTHRIKLYIIVAAIFLVVIIVCIYPKEGAAPKLGGTNAEVASGSAAVQEPETGKELFAENPEQGLTQKKTIGFYADAPDSYYQLINDAFTALAQQDPDLDWDIEYKVGDRTPQGQLSAVDGFIGAKVDAVIVIQNNVETTSKCIAKCKKAGIPYFGAAHYFGNAANAGDSAGSTNYDFIACGQVAGGNAIASGVKKLIVVEGKDQGYTSDQTLGFLQAYEKAGKRFGNKADGTKWTAKEIATKRPKAKDIKGKRDITVVSWLSVDYTSEAAQAEMAKAASALGEKGWDGAYVQTNPMVDGVIKFMSDAGLTTDRYWIGSNNGLEQSWQWAKDGKISMDVDQPPMMEGALLYQMLKAYFSGQEYRKHLCPYLIPYTKANISEVEPALVPVSDINRFIEKINGNAIVWDINDKNFIDLPGNWD